MNMCVYEYIYVYMNNKYVYICLNNISVRVCMNNVYIHIYVRVGTSGGVTVSKLD